MPIYYNAEHSYCTIRFFKSSSFKPVENYKYNVDFNIKIKIKDGKTFVNCHLTKLVFVSKPEKIDEGLLLDLDDDEEE
jgi:hypothetical protein